MRTEDVDEDEDEDEDDDDEDDAPCRRGPEAAAAQLRREQRVRDEGAHAEVEDVHRRLRRAHQRRAVTRRPRAHHRRQEHRGADPRRARQDAEADDDCVVVLRVVVHILRQGLVVRVVAARTRERVRRQRDHVRHEKRREQQRAEQPRRARVERGGEELELERGVPEQQALALEPQLQPGPLAPHEALHLADHVAPPHADDGRVIIARRRRWRVAATGAGHGSRCCDALPPRFSRTAAEARRPVRCATAPATNSHRRHLSRQPPGESNQMQRLFFLARKPRGRASKTRRSAPGAEQKFATRTQHRSNSSHTACASPPSCLDLHHPYSYYLIILLRPTELRRSVVLR